MKVFVSWSGVLSKAVALVLRKYLPCVLQNLDVFMSKHDLQSGVRWSLELAKELENSNFGLLCLTTDNLTSSWLLFEAGALTKHADGRACCLLVGDLKPTNVAGPLAQFQNRPFEKEEIRTLLKELNKRLSTPLDGESLRLVFEKWWPDIEKEYSRALDLRKPINPPPERTEKEILDEILLKVRTIERNVIKSGNYPSLYWDRHQQPLLLKTLTSLTDDQRRLFVELLMADIQGSDLTRVVRHSPVSDVKAFIDGGILRNTLSGKIKISDGVSEIMKDILESYAPNESPQVDG